MEILLASPRGFCAGVERAIDTVHYALEHYGAPVYVRHAIVHNTHVVRALEDKGAIFTDDIQNIPEGAPTVFSAHGVSPHIKAEAEARFLDVIDATCPLVSKVHYEAQQFSRKGMHILLIGHKGHVEVEGTMGHVPEAAITLIETEDDARKVHVPDALKVAVLCQTTLSLDETAGIMHLLKERFPALTVPHTSDICYATQNRQDAVKEMAPQVDAILVVGSSSSSNSKRLVEVALTAGCAHAALIDSPEHLKDVPWAHKISTMKRIGVTAGASAPEHVVQALLQALNPEKVTPFMHREENLAFNLPAKLRVHIQEEASNHGSCA